MVMVNRNTGHCEVFNTLMYMCVILCRWMCVGMFLQRCGDAQYVKGEVCVCVSGPTIITAASHADLVMHNSCGSAKV